MQDIDLVITDYVKAEFILTYSASSITHIVSICNSTDPFNINVNPPTGFDLHHGKKIALCFDDCTTDQNHHGYHMPQIEHIQKIIQFAEEIKAEPESMAKLLVHCEAGISRSPAAAYIIMAVLFGENREEEALNKVLLARVKSYPNSLMVAYADNLLNRAGAMKKQLKLKFNSMWDI